MQTKLKGYFNYRLNSIALDLTPSNDDLVLIEDNVPLKVGESVQNRIFKIRKPSAGDK